MKEETAFGENELLEELFCGMPGSVKLYREAERLLMSFPGTKRKIGRSQVSFCAMRCFAWVWPPVRKVKGRPDSYVLLSFSLGRKEASPRLAEALEPYPGRFMHHMVIAGAGDLDGQVLGWLEEAYEFSCR